MYIGHNPRLIHGTNYQMYLDQENTTMKEVGSYQIWFLNGATNIT